MVKAKEGEKLNEGVIVQQIHQRTPQRVWKEDKRNTRIVRGWKETI
jgi:hypothetical protein